MGTETRPLVSVIVTNYNYEHFVGEAIASAVGQSYAPLEVIVVDDGSTDGSRAVINDFGARIRTVFKDNGGMGSALNAGFLASRGDIVMFLDSDDALLPHAVATAAAAFEDASVAKSHWPQLEVDAAGTLTGGQWPKTPLPDGDLRAIVIAEGPMAGNGAPTSGNAWARGFLDRVMPMPEQDWRQHADSYLNTVACVFGSIHRIGEPLGRYRVHGLNDYASRPISERVVRTLEVYHRRCRLLSMHLKLSGVDVHPSTWKNGNAHYARLEKRVATFQGLIALIPAGECYIWVDQGHWGPPEMLAGRRKIAFPAYAGQDRGLPPDAEAAIEAVESMREAGAAFIVFVKPALWWLRGYPALDQHLRSHYRCDLASDSAIVFDMRG